MLGTVPRVSRACEHFPDGFDLHLLLTRFDPQPEKVDGAEEWRRAIHAFLLKEGVLRTLGARVDLLTLGTRVPRPAGITYRLINVVKNDPRFVVTGSGQNMAVEASPSGALARPVGFPNPSEVQTPIPDPYPLHPLTLNPAP